MFGILGRNVLIIRKNTEFFVKADGCQNLGKYQFFSKIRFCYIVFLENKTNGSTSLLKYERKKI